MLNLDSESRSRNPVLPFSVLLALAVFCWGLHYKLSLYHRLKHQPAAQSAKLLSQRERPDFSVEIESRSPGTGPLLGVHPSSSFHPHWATFLAAASFGLPSESQGLFELPPNRARPLCRSTTRGARPPPLAA